MILTRFPLTPIGVRGIHPPRAQHPRNLRTLLRHRLFGFDSSFWFQHPDFTPPTCDNGTFWNILKPRSAPSPSTPSPRPPFPPSFPHSRHAIMKHNETSRSTVPRSTSTPRHSTNLLLLPHSTPTPCDYGTLWNIPKRPFHHSMFRPCHPGSHQRAPHPSNLLTLPFVCLGPEPVPMQSGWFHLPSSSWLQPLAFAPPPKILTTFTSPTTSL
jgi:hypothetical protein